MIIFVVVTAVLNIGLGYALAVHLGGAHWPFGRRAAIADGIATDDLATEAPHEFTSAMAENSLSPAAPSAEPEPWTPPPATPVDAAAPAVELEQDVLAGIEEFRNQLAQIKAQTADEPAALAAAK